jgi:Na+/proline symporter
LIIATAAYLAVCIFIGIYTSRVKVRKASDFFLAGGGLHPIVVSLAMMATVFSAWFILGHQGTTYLQGVPYIAHFMHIPLMGMISLLFFPRLWAVARRNGNITPSELFGNYFDSELVRILIVVVAALYAVPYVALQLRGAGYTLETLSGGRVTAFSGAIVLGVVVVLYVFLGGLKAAAYTDSIQGVLLCIGAFLLGATTIGAVAALNPEGFFPQFKLGIEAQGVGYYTLPSLGETWSWPYILSIALATCGIYFSPSYMMLVTSARTTKTFRWQGIVIMTCIMGFMYFIFSAIVGMGGRNIVTDLANTDALSLEVVFNYMPPVAFVITALGILAAMNSTAAGYLANTSTIFARDLYVRYINKDAPPRKQVFMGRMMVLVIVIIAVIFSVAVLDLLVLLGTFATAFGLLLAPAIFAVTYCPRITKQAINLGLICGIVTVMFTYFGPVRYPLGIHMGGWGLIVNVAVVAVVTKLTAPPSKEALARTHGMWDERYR